jgi:hypothetical protein
MKPWILAPLAFAASAHATELNHWSVEDGEGGDPQGQLAFPVRLGVQYRF